MFTFAITVLNLKLTSYPPQNTHLEFFIVLQEQKKKDNLLVIYL